jgi:hypothetical protein
MRSCCTCKFAATRPGRAWMVCARKGNPACGMPVFRDEWCQDYAPEAKWLSPPKEAVK